MPASRQIYTIDTFQPTGDDARSNRARGRLSVSPFRPSAKPFRRSTTLDTPGLPERIEPGSINRPLQCYPPSGSVQCLSTLAVPMFLSNSPLSFETQGGKDHGTLTQTRPNGYTMPPGCRHQSVVGTSGFPGQTSPARYECPSRRPRGVRLSSAAFRRRPRSHRTRTKPEPTPQRLHTEEGNRCKLRCRQK